MRGREDLLRVPKWLDSSCQTVTFPPYRFYPDKQVHVQITVNHIKLNDSVKVHDAVTAWTENISVNNFTVCALQAGRKKEKFSLPLLPALIGLPIKGSLLKHSREPLICPNGGVVQTARRWRFPRYDGNILNVSRTVFFVCRSDELLSWRWREFCMGLIGVCYMKQKHQTNENYHRKIMRKVKRNL